MANRSDDRKKKFDSIFEEMESKYGSKKENTSSSSSTTPATSSSSVETKQAARQSKFDNVFAEMEARYNKSASVDDAYINAFLKDAQDFLNSSANTFKNLNWSSATSDSAWREKYSSISQREAKIRSYLNKNKDTMDASTYKEIEDLLNQFRSNKLNVSSAFRDAKRFYSQWESEQQYNWWDQYNGKSYGELSTILGNLEDGEEKKWLSGYAGFVDQQEKLSYDLDAGAIELETLKKERDEVKSLQEMIYDAQHHPGKYTQQQYDAAVSRYKALTTKYGDYRGAEDAVNKKIEYLAEAKRLQNADYLASVSDPNSENFDPEYAKYKGYSSTLRDSGYYDWEYEYINQHNNPTVSGTEIVRDFGSDAITLNRMADFEAMTNEEVATYNYYYNKFGKEAAKKYLDSVQLTINTRRAAEMYSGMEDETLLELAFSVAAGLDQFSTGVQGLMQAAIGNEEYVAPSAVQIASGMVREDLKDVGPDLPDLLGGGSLGQAAYDLGVTTSNMAPSILASTAIGMLNPTAGAIVGNTMMGASAGGNAYLQKINLGYTKEQATAYGMMVGTSEALLQYALGGIGKLGGKGIQTLLKNLDAVDNVLARVAQSAGGKFVLSAGSEAFEEGLQSVLEPYLWQAVAGGNASVDLGETLYSALMGFVTGGVFEGGEIGANAAGKYIDTFKQNTAMGRDIMDTEGAVNSLMMIGDDMVSAATGREQKKLMRQVEKVSSSVDKGSTSNATARKVANLYNTIKGSLDTQSHAEIVKALTAGKDGFSENKAKKVAGALVAMTNGLPLTEEQSVLLESVKDNPAVLSIVEKVNSNQSPIGQRNQQLRQLRQDVTVNAFSKAITKQVTEKEFTPEGDYKVSVDNKTIRTDTNEEIDIKGVKQISKGKLVLELADGSEIDAKSVSFANEADALIYEAVARLGDNIDADSANQLIGQFKGGNAMVFARGIAQAYTYGFYGVDKSEMFSKHSLADKLTDAQRDFAYDLGKKYRPVKDANDKTEAVKKLAKSGKAPSERGVFYLDKDGNATDIETYLKTSGIKLNDLQKTGIEAMRKMSKMMGIRFNVFETWTENGKSYYLDENGEVVEGNHNGFYDTVTGEIYIDLHAGNDYQGTMLFTVAHEVTHFMRQWSPEHFTKIAQIVFQHGGMKGKVSEMVALRQANAKAKGKPISYDGAMEEVVADGMETILKDGKVVEFMADVKKTDHVAWEKLKGWFKNLAKFLRKMIWAYKSQSAQTTEGAKVAEFSQDLLNQIERIYAEGAVASGENYQEAIDSYRAAQEQFSTANMQGSADGAVVQSEAASAIVEAKQQPRTEYEAFPKQIMSLSDGSGTLLHSIEGLKATKLTGLSGRTVNGYTGRDVRAYAMRISGFTEAQIQEVNKFMDSMADFMEKAGVTYKFIGLQDVKDAKLHYTYNSDGSIKSIVLSAMVKNGDYPVNFDLSSICKKREAMSKLIDNLAKRGSLDNGTVKLTPANIFRINTALKDAGYETACLGCFVESKRYNSLEWAKKFCDKWNAAVKKVNPNATYFGYGNATFNEDSFTLEQAIKIENAANKYITTTKTERLANAMKKYQAKAEAGLPLVESFSKAARDRLIKSDTISDELKEKYLEGDVTTWNMADVEFLLENGILPGASLSNKQAVTEMVKSGEAYQHLLRPSDLLTDRGISKLEALPNFHGVLYGHYGSGTPKLMQSYTPYNSEIALLPANKNKDQSLEEYLYSIAGVRMQSFSDFQIQNIYDYLQMVADLAARKLPAHAYTKEISFAKLLGMTGIKTNLSVMFDIDPMVEKARAGLTKLNKLVHRGEYARVVLEDEQGRWVYNIGDYQTQKMFAEAFPDEAKRFLQSIGFADAVKLQTTPGYSANCGIIGVGYSDLGIFAMLDDNRIRYIIPYHASSLPADIKLATNIALGTDYTPYQNNMKIKEIVDRNGNKVDWSIKEAYKRLKSGQAVIDELNEKIRSEGWVVSTTKAQNGHGSYGLYEDLQDTNDPKQTASNFMDWCIGNGTLPLFYQFASHENYYKLLYDFNVYDCVTEEYAPQQAVTNTYPTMVDGQVQPGNVTDGGFNTEYLKETADKQMAFMNAYNENRDADLERMAENMEDGNYTLYSDRDFSYKELVARKDLQGHIIGRNKTVKLTSDGSIDEDFIISEVLQQCKVIQTKSKTPTYYLEAPDIGKNVKIIRDGIVHGFSKHTSKTHKKAVPRSLINARVALDLPQILRNSIEVNRSNKGNNGEVEFSHVLIGVTAMESANGTIEYYAVRSVVEARKNEGAILTEANVIGRLHSVNAKKIGKPHAKVGTRGTVARAYSSLFGYSVADLLNDVKKYFADTFSNDVYKHFGMKREYNEHFSKYLLFSDRDSGSVTAIIGSLYNYNTVNFDKAVVDFNLEHFEEQWKKGYYSSVVDTIAKQTGKSKREVWDAFAAILMRSEGIARVDGKTYINVHELNESNLRKAFELGGLAAPSIGIVDVDKPVTHFGDISLIFPDIFNPENTPTYYGDSYSSSFPAVGKFTDETMLTDALTDGFDGMDWGGILTNEEAAELLEDLYQVYLYDDEQRTSHAISKNGFSSPKEFAKSYDIKGIVGLQKLYKGLKAQYNSYEQFLEDFAEKAFTNQRMHKTYTGNPDFDWNNRVYQFNAYTLENAVEEITSRGDEDFRMALGEKATGYDELTSDGMRARLKSGSENFYEVKPQRAVYIGEATYAVVPEKTSADVIEMLEYEGVQVVKYTAKEGYNGIADGRAEAIKGILENDTTGIRYSDRDSSGRQLSKGQQEFFKDSKVRDANGNLLVMYHGTSKGGYTVFDTYGGNHGLFGVGSYFTDNEEIAQTYTKKGRGTSPQVYEAYLNIKNPLDMDAKADPAEWAEAFPDVDFPESGTNEAFYRAVEQWCEDEMMYKWDAIETIQAGIESGMGYDGITHIGGGRVDPNGVRHRVYIAFQPEQIKRTDNQNPTTDPDIRYSDRDYVVYDRTAILKEETVDRWLRAYATKSSPGYAQAYIAYMKPDQFLELTTSDYAARKYIESESYELDEEKFAKATSDQPLFLDIDHETGKVYGHEGRHRCVALQNAGIEYVPVLLFDTSNKYSKEDITSVLLKGQFNKYHSEFVFDAIPLSYENRDRVIQNFATQSTSQQFWEKTGTKNTLRFQDRDSDSVSNRSLLANAFEGLAQNDIERNKIQEYKSKITLINAEEKKLREINEKIKEMSFAKGPGDTKRIRELRDEATMTANRINTYDKQLLRLEASKPLQDVLNREKRRAYKKAEERGKEALAAYKEQVSKTQRELLNKWKDTRKRAVENHERTVMRNKIRSVVGELNGLLLSEDKKRHVPDSLKKAVASALALVNMDTVKAEERAAKYAALIAKETDPDKIDAYTVTMENILRQGEKMGQKLKELRDAYDEIQNSDDPDIANGYDPAISGAITELSQSIGNTSLADMSIEQLSDVYDMYKMVLTKVRDANKSLIESIKESISNRASRVVGEVRRAGGEHKYRATILDPIREFFWNNAKPVYAMEHIGSETMTEAYNQVRKGEDTWAKDVTEARAYYLDKSKKYGYDSWDFDKKYTFKSASDLEFELTLEQILSLYAYSKREQAHDHLRLGGFVFDSNIETYKEKGSKLLKYKVNTADAHQITPEILAKIIGTLTEDQMGFVDEMQDYLSTVMGAKGNEVTKKMYGVKLFKEKFYFPLKSAKQFMFEQNEVAGEVRIKNSGFTNKVVAKANNPVILNNFMDVWANHVNDMAMYHSFVLPLEDFNRIFNYNSPKSENVPAVSVKGTIQNAYSPAAVNYVKQLITDLNGGARSDPRETFAKSMTARFKKAKVFASTSVVIQQPSAIGRAFALVDPKYFHPTKDGMNHDELWAELKKYAPVAIIKEMGYFDTNMGKSTQDFIKAKEYSTFKEKAKAVFTDSAYRDELISKLPALADELTWCAIWNAVKRETLAKNPGLDIKSEPFLMLAGSRFTEVVTKTQVYDSVLSRSANMRSKGGLMSMITSFMAEPTTTINMLEDALRKSKRGYKGYAGRVFASVAVSIILNNALVALVYGGRDDDEDETFAEKYMQAFVSGMIDDINPITYLPFVKDMWSVLQGYDVERSDMSLVSDLADALKGLVKAYSSEDGDVVGAWHDIAGSVANIGGVPLDNIRREINGAVNFLNTIIEDFNGRSTTWDSMGDALLSTVKDSTPVWGWLPGEKKSDNLYDAIISGDTAYVNRLKGSYKDEDAYHNAVRKALRENDPRIMEAAKAGFNGDPSERVRIAKLIIADGFAQDDVVVAINAEINAMKPDEASDPKKKGYYTTEDFAKEIANGDQAAANAAKADIIDTAKKNGKTAKEAENSFYISAKSEMKKLFLSGGLSKNKVINALVTFCDETEEDAAATISGWEFELENGFSYSKKTDAYYNGEITKQELKSILMDEGGMTSEEADYQIEAYDWEKQGYENVSAAAVREYNKHCASSNVPKDTYLSIRTFANNTENDKDASGKSIAYSAMKKIMAKINAQPGLTKAQKTAIARSLGWSEKNIQKYKPW